MIGVQDDSKTLYNLDMKNYVIGTFSGITNLFI